MYRFALYGLTEFGKTVYLAALAMPPAKANSQEITRTWIKDLPEYPVPPGDESTWDKDQPAAAFHLGKKLLDEAVAKLKTGGVPRATEPGPPLRYVFDFGTPERPLFRVELIDFAGELILPDATADQQALCLREHCKGVDGLLVLAPAPLPGVETVRLAEELYRLQQAFAELKGQMEHFPLSLLITKWDRRGLSDQQDDDTREKALKQFLVGPPEPPHAILAQVLRNAVGANNFHVRAVSAFGAAVQKLVSTPNGSQVTVEIPESVNPLPSYGLEAPFDWMVKRRDQIDLSDFQDKVTGLRWSQFWHPRRPWKLWARGHALQRRFPTGSADKKATTRLTTRCLGLGLFRAFVFFLLVGLALEIGETALTGMNYRHIQTVMGRHNADPNEHKACERWLEVYVYAPGWRNLVHRWWFLSRKAAAQELQEFRDQREKRAWDLVTRQAPDLLRQLVPAQDYVEQFKTGSHFSEANGLVGAARAEQAYETLKAADDSAQQATLAEKFIKVFPNSPHVPKAQKLVLQWEREVKRRANQHAFREVRGQVETLVARGKVRDEKELTDLKRRLAKLPPHKDAETTDQFNDLMRLSEQLAAFEIQQVKDAKEQDRLKEWQEFLTKYDRVLKKGDSCTAAKLLVERQPETAELKKLRGDFPAQMLAVQEILRRKSVDDRLYPEARERLEAVWMDQNTSVYLRKSDQDRLKKMIRKVKMAHDLYLYEEVARKKHLESVQQYLNEAPLQTMKDQVKACQRYLQLTSGQRTCPKLTVKLKRIDWINHWNRNGNIVTVWCDNKAIIEETLTSRKNTSSEDVGQAVLENVKLTEQITIYVRIRLPATLWEGDGVCNVEVKGRPEDFRNRTLELTGNCTNRVTLVIPDLGSFPELASWKE